MSLKVYQLMAILLAISEEDPENYHSPFEREDVHFIQSDMFLSLSIIHSDKNCKFEKIILNTEA